MEQFSVPPLVAAATAGNLNQIVTDRLQTQPERIILSRPLGEGWHGVSAREFEAEVRAVAKGLIAAGINVGDRIALMSRTRYEWTVLDFAIWSAGAVPVPIYETSSTEQINWILRDSGASALIVETPQNRETANGALTSKIHSVWTITDGALSHMTEGGKSISDEEVEKRRRAATPDDLATLIYTSGTTGNPKGVQLTHRNFLFECGNVVQGASDLFLKPGGSTLL